MEFDAVSAISPHRPTARSARRGKSAPRCRDGHARRPLWRFCENRPRSL